MKIKKIKNLTDLKKSVRLKKKNYLPAFSNSYKAPISAGVNGLSKTLNSSTCPFSAAFHASVFVPVATVSNAPITGLVGVKWFNGFGF